MIFRFLEGSVRQANIGQSIVGMMQNKQRPMSVTLTLVELLYLKSHPEYIDVLAKALAINE